MAVSFNSNRPSYSQRQGRKEGKEKKECKNEKLLDLSLFISLEAVEIYRLDNYKFCQCEQIDFWLYFLTNLSIAFAKTRRTNMETISRLKMDITVMFRLFDNLSLPELAGSVTPMY